MSLQRPLSKRPFKGIFLVLWYRRPISNYSCMLMSQWNKSASLKTAKACSQLANQRNLNECYLRGQGPFHWLTTVHYVGQQCHQSTLDTNTLLGLMSSSHVETWCLFTSTWANWSKCWLFGLHRAALASSFVTSSFMRVPRRSVYLQATSAVSLAFAG